MSIFNKKCLISSLTIIFLSQLCQAQTGEDLVSTGSNSWIFHTPDDGRTTLYISPKINGEWNWGTMSVESNGTLHTLGLETRNLITLRYLQILPFDDNSSSLYLYKPNNAYHRLYNDNTNFGIYNSLTNTSPLVIDLQDRIGIGTASPTERLAVNGNIRAKEIKVEAANWPDYVFKRDYELKPLAELNAYIKEHGHLPDMPEAAEAEKEGVSLGEMNKLLLKKVEELTLYIIDLQKQIDTLKKN
ncbi:hypothetical protein ACFU8T_13405 [Sphingobacterium spiritivorum]|uniref:Uncharacterized protein n=1 Tax=Sphingobacterium spiritivorum ATCC 33861 TaxID=525373 RepID=D7VJV9_SPHSI|nr:hypothetical protein [Sphingobacterium spiritivorum]EFK58561.1 hypothetical protein HMPREF0766_11278 [Sphingobacterium spiritivorum ATCC 33861]QQT34526.1 hypothetical protein I6J01_14555 [Sphingobacterium spiritivorum]WQD35392.1 hypothetical protein U0038_06490 [Sphingobacterium spiritivorum]SUJ00299.1 Uncharacterised protein [Sphingobacterium spiritivorum]